MPKLDFTKSEAEVLLHRLTLHDCIAEALTDYDPECDPAPAFTRADVEATSARLERELASKRTLTIETDIERAVIEDVVDGNTFGPGLDDALDDQLTKRQIAEWRAVMRRLNDKLHKFAGIESRFPR